MTGDLATVVERLDALGLPAFYVDLARPEPAMAVAFSFVPGLRAAELAPFGMIGVGEVFEAYRSGVLDGDDEVALLHAPAELGYRGLTVALVELRHALAALGGDRGTAAALVARVKDLAFSARHPDVIEDLARRELGEETARVLMRRLAASSVKQDDAAGAYGPSGAPSSAAGGALTPAHGFLGAWRA